MCANSKHKLIYIECKQYMQTLGVYMHEIMEHTPLKVYKTC